MNMASHHYRYEPLPGHGKHIRLLTIFPSRDNSSVICTSLTVHSIPLPDVTRREKLRALLLLPSYFAISYRWMPGTQQSILVNGKSFDVDENVRDALRVLRSYTSMPLRFWIDCICINQKDDIEKSEQIPLMSYVYGLSSLTLVWLELPTEESKQAMDYIFKLTQHPYMVRAVYMYNEVQSFTPITRVAETFVAKIQRTIRAEFIRQGFALILRILLLLQWALDTLTIVLGNSFFEKSVFRCHFQTLEEYKLSGSIQEDHTFSLVGRNIQNAWQDGLRQGRIRTLQKYAVENGQPLSEALIAQVNSQQLTLVGLLKDTWQDGLRQGRIRKLREIGQLKVAAIAENEDTKILESTSESVNPVLPPNAGPTSNAIKAPKMPTITNKRDENRKIWQPSAYTHLSIDRNEFKEKASLIERTLFSETEYFNRMWTLQEVCASKNATIIHGGNLIPLSDLLRVVQYLESELGTESEHVKKAVRIQWINAEFRSQRRLPLRVLLYESRDRACGNPRDKIYALLGLMLERPTILVRPAYDQPEAEVYTNATRFLVATGRSLDIICGHEQHKRQPGYPSWTPDFTQFATDDARPLIDLSGRNTVYRASLREVPENILDPTYLPEDWQSLSVEAVYLGTIEHLSNHSVGESVFQRAEKWKDAIQHRFMGHPRDFSLLQNALDLVQYCCNYYTDTRAVKSRWLSTPEGFRVLHDLARSLRELDHEKHNLCSKYILTLVCGRLDRVTRCGIADVMDLFCQPYDYSQTSKPPPETFFNAIDSGTANRLLFVTENAIVSGAAPTSAKPQDQVFVLLGCSAPVIRRHLSGNTYELVGECYCQGMMDGEAEKNANVRSIVLR